MTQHARAQPVFFALWLDPIAAVRLAALVPGGHTAIADYHLTLAFAGPVNATTRSALCAGASRVRGTAFRLTLDTVDRWVPGPLCVAVPSAPPSALMALARDLQQMVQLITGRRELRQYRPHVTLARRDCGVPPGAVVPISWVARGFVLAGPCAAGAPRYTIVGEWPLDAETV